MVISATLLLFDLYSAYGMISHEAFSIILSESYRVEEKNNYRIILGNNFPGGNPTPHYVLNKDYLSRKYQDRHNYNCPTKIYQRGLEVRIKNKQIKLEKARREERIERNLHPHFDCYENAGKRNGTWKKRHYPYGHWKVKSK